MNPNDQRSSSQIWGLTGGIGSGKSTVAQILSELGIPVLDADTVAREVTQEDPETRNLIRAEFGTLNREEIREIVFNSSQKRKTLEAILHPIIKLRSGEKLSQLAALHPNRVAVYEATLLVETGRHKDLTGLITVEAPEELRRKRLQENRGMSSDLVEKILSTQATEQQRRAAATIVIENSGSMEDLRSLVRKLAKDKRWF